MVVLTTQNIRITVKRCLIIINKKWAILFLGTELPNDADCKQKDNRQQYYEYNVGERTKNHLTIVGRKNSTI